MAEPITLADDGSLIVPDEPVIPFIEGDGTGVDIWPATRLVLDAAAARHGRRVGWMEVLAGARPTPSAASGCRPRPSTPFVATWSGSKGR